MIWIMKMFLYMSVLVMIEVLCTGIASAFDKTKPPDTRKQLVGWSYVWMFPIYFLFPILFELFSMLFSSFAWYWLILISYFSGVIFITLIESGYGFLLEKTIGFCVWSKYSKEQDGITWLGGYSRYKISLTFGLMAIAFYYFDMFFNYCIKGI